MRARVLLAVAVLGLVPAAAGWARVLIPRDEALAQVYGADARIETRTAYLEDHEVEAVRQRARAPFSSRRATYYAAARGDTALGMAFVDRTVVRTMPQTLLVALDARGAVLAVEVLAWEEPDDYRPPRRWLDLAAGAADPAAMRPGEALPRLAGVTLTARAVAAAVRRALALHAVLSSPAPAGRAAAAAP